MCSILFIFICYHFLCKYDYLVTSQCHLLIILSNSLDPDQAGQYIRPDLDPNCLTLIVYIQVFFFEKKMKKKNKKKNQQMTKKILKEFSQCKELILNSFLLSTLFVLSTHIIGRYVVSDKQKYVHILLVHRSSLPRKKCG